MSFAENLKKARIDAGYKSAKDFSDVLGIEYPTYIGYENKGREPKYDILCRIAERLGVTVDSLLGYSADALTQAVNACQAAGFRVERDDGGGAKIEGRPVKLCYILYDDTKKDGAIFGPYEPETLTALVSDALSDPQLRKNVKRAHFVALWNNFAQYDFDRTLADLSRNDPEPYDGPYPVLSDPDDDE